MLSKFSQLFQSTPSPKTRFETTLELKQILPQIAALRVKETELKNTAEVKGVGSIDYRKWMIITSVLTKMQDRIEVFNANLAHDDHEEEIQEIIKLTQDLANIINKTINDNEDILLTERNGNRKFLNKVVGISSYAATLVIGATAPITTLGRLATLFYFAPKTSEGVTELTGLNVKMTQSFKILNELFGVLTFISENLGLNKLLNSASVMDDDHLPAEYVCPINQTIMQHPVICTLDGISYEKEAIEKWLSEHRTSPFNRARIPSGVSVEEVLVKNRALKDLIEKFISSTPQALSPTMTAD